MDSIAVKPRKKTKFFPCFRSSPPSNANSLGIIDPCTTINNNNNNNNHHVAADDSDSNVGENEAGLGFLDVLPVAFSSESSNDEKKTTRHCVLSRLIRAVILVTSLGKKIGKRKRKHRRKNSIKAKLENDHHSIDGRIVSDFYHNSSSSSLCTISVPFSSSLCSSRSSSYDANDKQPVPLAKPTTCRQRSHGKTWSVGASSGWFVLLICLVSLVFSGKFLAVVCTSAWILFFPRQTLGLKPTRD